MIFTWLIRSVWVYQNTKNHKIFIWYSALMWILQTIPLYIYVIFCSVTQVTHMASRNGGADFHLNSLMIYRSRRLIVKHDDIIKCKHFPRHWPFVRGIHRSPVNSPHKGDWRGTLVFSLIYARTNGWMNTRDAGDLRRHRAHYDIIVTIIWFQINNVFTCIFNTITWPET